MPCLLSPTVQSDSSSGHLRLLLEAAGGVVLTGPDAQRMPPAAIAGFSPGDRPPGLLLAWPDQRKPGQLVAKDVKWARECGFVGWPLYNKEWLVKSVLGYEPLWGEFCGTVQAV